MTKKENSLPYLSWGLLTAVVPFSIDMYLPGLPPDCGFFTYYISLSSFFIGIAIGQLDYGPILDRFGRKAPLYGGLISP